MSDFPRLYHLLDHDKKVSTLYVESQEDLDEIALVAMQANLACRHDLPGKCLEIEGVTK